MRYSPHCNLKKPAKLWPGRNHSPREEWCEGPPPSRKSFSPCQAAAKAAWRHHQGGLQQPPTTHRDTRPWEITLVHRSAGSAVLPAVNKCLNKSFYLGFPSLPPKTFCSDGNPVHCDFTDVIEMPVSSPSKASAGLETKPMSPVPHWCHLALLLHSLAAARRFTPSDFQYLVQCIPQNK